MKRLLLLINLLLMLAALVYTWAVYPLLPETIPTHLNASGRPDAWGPRNFWNVALMLIMQWGTMLLLAIPYWKPQLSNYPPGVRARIESDPLLRERAHDLVRLMLLGMAFWINLLVDALQFSVLRIARGMGPELHWTIIVLWTMILFGGIFWFIVKLYRLGR